MKAKRRPMPRLLRSEAYQAYAPRTGGRMRRGRTSRAPTPRPVAHQGSRLGEMQNTTMPVANTWK